MTGAEVSPNQIAHRVHLRPGEVGYETGRLAEREIGEAGGHLAGVDRLKSDARRDRDHRQLGHLFRRQQGHVENWVARSVVQGTPDASTIRSPANLDSK